MKPKPPIGFDKNTIDRILEKMDEPDPPAQPFLSWRTAALMLFITTLVCAAAALSFAHELHLL